MDECIALQGAILAVVSDSRARYPTAVTNYSPVIQLFEGVLYASVLGDALRGHVGVCGYCSS